jgi:hypothetical protein
VSDDQERDGQVSDGLREDAATASSRITKNVDPAPLETPPPLRKI